MTIENTDNSNAQNDGSSHIEVGSNDLTNNTDVSPFEKHINIALEAQDGPQDKNATDTQGRAKDQAAATEGAGGPKKDASSGAGSGSNNTPQQQPTNTNQQQGAGTPKDLTLSDGTVIKGGAERRFYEKAQIASQRADVAARERDDAIRERDEARQQLQTMQQTVQQTQGLAPQELASATRLFRDLRTDPSGTLKKLLAEAVASGYTIEGIQTGLDAAAMERLLENRLGTTNAQQGPTEEEIVAAATREAEQFFSQFPDARPHDELIAKVMRDHPGVDLRTAYFELKTQFVERGFDWSRPLAEQLVERANAGNQQQQQQSQATQPQQQQQSGPGLPASRPSVPNAANTKDIAAVAHESDDMEAIIRSSMRDAGLNV